MKLNGRRGVPIGAFTSQPIGNFAASRIDHTMKEKYHVKCLHRYCDDNVMLARSKSEALFLPVENVIVKRRSLGDGKSAYYFEE